MRGKHTAISPLVISAFYFLLLCLCTAYKVMKHNTLIPHGVLWLCKCYWNTSHGEQPVMQDYQRSDLVSHVECPAFHQSMWPGRRGKDCLACYTWNDIRTKPLLHLPYYTRNHRTIIQWRCSGTVWCLEKAKLNVSLALA